MAIEKQMIDPNAKFVINASILTGHTLRWENGIIKIYNRFGMPDTAFRAADMPTVDAVEVVHGQWVNPYINRYGHPCHCCSVCGFKASYQDKNYCPNCGAKMEELK